MDAAGVVLDRGHDVVNVGHGGGQRGGGGADGASGVGDAVDFGVDVRHRVLHAGRARLDVGDVLLDGAGLGSSDAVALSICWVRAMVVSRRWVCAVLTCTGTRWVLAVSMLLAMCLAAT